MARPGRGSKKPKSLSEWNRRERFLRFFAKSAGYELPPPWLNQRRVGHRLLAVLGSADTWSFDRVGLLEDPEEHRRVRAVLAWLQG